MPFAGTFLLGHGNSGHIICDTMNSKHLSSEVQATCTLSCDYIFDTNSLLGNAVSKESSCTNHKAIVKKMFFNNLVVKTTFFKHACTKGLRSSKIPANIF